jgi:putative transposase
MSTYTQITYHVVFATKGRRPGLRLESRDPLFRYMMGIAKGHGVKLLRLNAMEDHVHLLFALPPSLSLAGFMRDLKVATSLWIKESRLHPAFEGWQEGYGAFTISHRDRPMLVNYIRNQEAHHAAESSAEELRRLLEENGVEHDPKYFE